MVITLILHLRIYRKSTDRRCSIRITVARSSAMIASVTDTPRPNSSTKSGVNATSGMDWVTSASGRNALVIPGAILPNTTTLKAKPKPASIPMILNFAPCPIIALTVVSGVVSAISVLPLMIDVSGITSGPPDRYVNSSPAPYQTRVAPVEVSNRTFSIAAHLDEDMAALTRRFQEFSAERLELAIALLKDAPRLWILAPGQTANLVPSLRRMLLQSRSDVAVLGLDDASLAEELSQTGPRDALILIAVKPWPKRIKAIAEYAATTRMNITAIVDQASLPAARRGASLASSCHVMRNKDRLVCR